MNINRHNYEEWFLLYADHELTAAQRREVEAFMERNPDLAGELDLFQQMKLDPSEELGFSGKASLYRQEADEVSEEDALLISYLDGEMHGEDREAMEHRLANEPVLATRLEQFRMAQLPAETIVFPDKASLYRKSERTTPIISMRWVRVAVAAAIIISGGALWFSQQSAVSSQQTGGGQQIASHVQRPAEGSQQSAVSGQETVRSQQQAGGTQPSSEIASGSEQPAIQHPASGIRNPAVTIAPQERNNDVNSNDVALNNDNEQPKTNNLPTTDTRQPTTDIAVNVPAPSTVGSTTEIVDRPSVNTVAKADYATQALLNPDKQDEPVLDDGGRTRKSPFRGLVRKANRFLNKATNPDPDKATVKVASFEIALGR